MTASRELVDTPPAAPEAVVKGLRQYNVWTAPILSKSQKKRLLGSMDHPPPPTVDMNGDERRAIERRSRKNVETAYPSTASGVMPVDGIIGTSHPLTALELKPDNGVIGTIGLDFVSPFGKKA